MGEYVETEDLKPIDRKLNEYVNFRSLLSGFDPRVEKKFVPEKDDKILSQMRASIIRSMNRSKEVFCRQQDCRKTFPSSLKRASHERRHSEFPCHNCNLKMDSLRDWITHRVSHEETVRSCPLCTFMTMSHARITKHMDEHGRPFEGFLRCMICANIFKSSTALSLHQRQHNDQVRICEMCHDIVTDANEITHFIKYHRLKPGTNMYKEKLEKAQRNKY